MNEEASTKVEGLRLAIHGVTAPFACEGAWDAERPVALVFMDGSRYEVTRAESAFEQEGVLKPMLGYFKPAPFGDGKKTRYDPSVRKALQLKAEKGKLRVENFDPASAGILDEIRRQLLPQSAKAVTAELYAANVYLGGGHFAPHKDTPRGENMFGTLVVCLPSLFRNGALVL